MLTLGIRRTVVAPGENTKSPVEYNSSGDVLGRETLKTKGFLGFSAKDEHRDFVSKSRCLFGAAGGIRTHVRLLSN